MIEKYRLGYMSPDQALRGLKTFQSRLNGHKGSEFREFALEALDRAAYSQYTGDVVRKVISAETRSGEG